MKIMTCDYCTLRDSQSDRSWITVDGVTERPANLCSRSCLVDWTEQLDGTRSPVWAVSLAS
jgi:hypothetical protein